MTCPHCHNTHSPSLLAIIGLLCVIGTAVLITYLWRVDRAISPPTEPQTRVILINERQTPVEIIEPRKAVK